jgi:hypothetical protein
MCTGRSMEARAEGRETHNVWSCAGKGDGRSGGPHRRGERGATARRSVTARIAINGRHRRARSSGMGEEVDLRARRGSTKKPPTLGATPAPEGRGGAVRRPPTWTAGRRCRTKWSLGERRRWRSGQPSLDDGGRAGRRASTTSSSRRRSMPRERGQGRGNSGVYTSWGGTRCRCWTASACRPADNEAGGIYQKAPCRSVNASLPPGEWQTYDITFTPARFDETGRKVEDATDHGSSTTASSSTTTWSLSTAPRRAA